MEACPRLDMFVVPNPLSATESSSLALVINKLIRIQYNENPEDFKKEVSEFTSLRNLSCHKIGISENSLKNLKKYYCQLNFFKNRFKVLESPLMKKGPFDFRWNDDEDDPSLTNYDNLDYEMGFVLFNIGIVHCTMGAQEDRTSSESMKKACAHFQNAAWAFHTLPDRHSLGEVTNLHHDYLTILSQICLAQAQECILEKSILDHKKPTIIVKVCAQVVEFYKQTNTKIESSKEHMKKTWGSDIVKLLQKYSLYKKFFYDAVAHFFMGVSYEEESKWGQALAYFQKANKNLKDSLDHAKYSNSNNAKIVIAFANDVIEGKFNIAKRENEFIYHDRVPEDIPELKGQSLVKGIGFEVNEENGGKDIFAKLIPLEAHTASSLYSEEKAKKLRQLGEKIEAKDEELNEFLLSMNLEQVPNAGDHIALPQELIEVAAQLSGVQINPVKKLSSSMAKLAEISADVEILLKEISEAIDNEDKDEKEFKAIVGKPPKKLDVSLSEELKRYKEAHLKASESNQTLHKAIQVHVENLKILGKSLNEIQSEIPSMADLEPEAEANIAQFQRIIKKVDEMKKQRETLMETIRMDFLNDDITKKLVLHKDKEMPEIFESELKKHEVNMKYIEQNLTAQSNIMKAITEVNAKYVSTRKKVADLIDARREKIGSLVDSFTAYENLMQKTGKALEFYEKLSANVKDLHTKVQKAIAENEREKDAVFAKLATNTTKPGISTTPSAPSRPTLKDYLNAGANQIPNQGYQKPAMMYPGYDQNQYPQGYAMHQIPNQMHPGNSQVSSQMQNPSVTQNQAYPQQNQQVYQGYYPPVSQGYAYPGYQAFPQQQQNPGQAFPPNYQNYGQQPNQNQDINPNDLSLI